MRAVRARGIIVPLSHGGRSIGGSVSDYSRFPTLDIDIFHPSVRRRRRREIKIRPQCKKFHVPVRSITVRNHYFSTISP